MFCYAKLTDWSLSMKFNRTVSGDKNSQMKKTMVSNTSKVKNDKSLQQKIRADISPIIHLPTLVENATRSINDANNNCGHE